jgi:hypothetical protein
MTEDSKISYHAKCGGLIYEGNKCLVCEKLEADK